MPKSVFAVKTDVENKPQTYFFSMSLGKTAPVFQSH